MAKHEQTNGICTYCCEQKPVTADHVPPKNLFSTPYPDNMWTVPACDECNSKKFSKDDEYFMHWLTISDKAKGHHDRDINIHKVIRGLIRQESERYKKSLLSNISFHSRNGADGLNLENQPAMSFEFSRLNSTASRIIRGQFFRVKEYLLPKDHSIKVCHISQFPHLYPNHFQLIADVYAEPMQSISNVFGFKFCQLSNELSYSSCWLLYFYGNLEFYCMT
jgi:hypothetical protein